MSRLPVVAVVGRPNVGKSTLVNRIIGSRSAVVEELAGVTRDRREFDVDWAGRDFVLVDTGGWEFRPSGDINISIKEQAEAAVSGADAVLFVVDGTTELSDDDIGVISVLRTADVPVILAANKIDNTQLEGSIDRFWRLGLGTPHPISAYHGRGVGELLDELISRLPESVEQALDDGVPRVAIVGRPNVGKSTLLNKLAGEERVLVSAEPGTTRDPIDMVVELDGEPFQVVDTAGIKRRTKIGEDADYYAMLRAREALQKADVALLVIDGTQGVTHQEQRLAEEIAEAGVGLIVLLNKWDAVDDETRAITEDGVGDRLSFVSWAPVLRVSAKTGSRVHRLPKAVRAVLESRRARIPTPDLNRLVRSWQEAHPPPVRRGKRPRIIYAVQADTEPPRIVLFVRGGELGPDYLRFLENRLRQEYDFVGTPILLHTRRRHQRRPEDVVARSR